MTKLSFDDAIKSVPLDGLSNLTKLVYRRDLRRLINYDLPFKRVSTKGEIMKQTEPCANCGHTLMMHVDGVCTACNKCTAFIPAFLKTKKETRQTSNQS